LPLASHPAFVSDEDAPPVTNPVTGVSLHEAPGEGAAEIRLTPGARGPAEHVHRTTEERFTVEEGLVHFRVDGRERELSAGAEVRVSPGTPHTFRNEGAERARMTVRTVPPNDRLGAVVATLFGLAHDGAVDDEGRPGPLRAAAMAEATLDETYFTGAPYPVQRAFGATVGPLARRLGYEATEERYLDEAFWRARAGGADEADREGTVIPVAEE
jgi:mannose-6-phosphate isomerase-like protein (cupin superfamily)